MKPYLRGGSRLSADGVLVKAALRGKKQPRQGGAARDVHAAAYPWQSRLGFLVRAGNAVGRVLFRGGGYRRWQKKRHKVWRGAVVKDGPVTTGLPLASSR